MIRTILLLLISVSGFSQDSLWTETPSIKDASTSPVTVGEEFSTAGGRLKAIKFWKNETAGNYVITLWQQTSGASLFSQQYRSTTTGWQKITLDLPIESGIYVIGVYFPNGKYVYTNALNPRTKGQLTGNSGLFAGGNFKPTARYTASFFVDMIVAKETPRKPLIVNAGKDTAYLWRTDSAKITGVVTGDNPTFIWSIDNSWGDVSYSGLTTLTPTIYFKEPDSGAVLILTGTDKYGTTSEHSVSVSVMPDFEPYIKRFGELIMNQLRFEMIRKWKAGE